MKPLKWYNAAGDRWCATCHAYVAVELFHRAKGAAPDGLARECRVCRRRLGRAAYRAHPERRERASARAMAWQAQHPERARAIHRQAQRTYATRLHFMAAQDSDPSEHEREDQAG